jgi:cytochrome c oxidase subunit 3
MSAHSTAIEKTASWGGGTSPYGVSYGKMMMWFFLISDAFTFSGFLVAYGFMRHKFTTEWPFPGDVFTHFPFYDGHIELLYVGLMTFILIMSSVTMVLAVEAGHRLKQNEVVLWLALTIVGGGMFLGSQAYEWYHFIHGTTNGAYVLDNGKVAQYVVENHEQNLNKLQIKGSSEIYTPAQIEAMGGEKFYGANLQKNEYGHPLFGDFFFFITGFHGFHVFSGVVINIIVLINVIAGVYQKRGHYEMVEKVGLYWHFVDLVWVFVFTFFYLV